MPEHTTEFRYGIKKANGNWLRDDYSEIETSTPSFLFTTFEMADKFTDCGDEVVSMWQCLGLQGPIAGE